MINSNITITHGFTILLRRHHENWFNFPAHHEPDEVNLWRPSSTMNFKAISEGAPFLFKLRSPNDYVVVG